jgi:hypothetical protein
LFLEQKLKFFSKVFQIPIQWKGAGVVCFKLLAKAELE